VNVYLSVLGRRLGKFPTTTNYLSAVAISASDIGEEVPLAKRWNSTMRSDDVPKIRFHVSGRFLTGTNRTQIIAKTSLHDAGQGYNLDWSGSWRGVSLVAGSGRGDASNIVAPTSRSPVTATKIVTSSDKLTHDTRQPRNYFRLSFFSNSRSGAGKRVSLKGPGSRRGRGTRDRAAGRRSPGRQMSGTAMCRAGRCIALAGPALRRSWLPL